MMKHEAKAKAKQLRKELGVAWWVPITRLEQCWVAQEPPAGAESQEAGDVKAWVIRFSDGHPWYARWLHRVEVTVDDASGRVLRVSRCR